MVTEARHTGGNEPHIFRFCAAIGTSSGKHAILPSVTITSTDDSIESQYVQLHDVVSRVVELCKTT
jgi:hypothetical protein